MEHLTIRSAGMADASTLASLMEQPGYPTEALEMEARLTGILPHRDYHTLVAELNRHIVGMLGVHLGHYYEKNGVYGQIVALVVEQEHQGQHIGVPEAFVKDEPNADWRSGQKGKNLLPIRRATSDDIDQLVRLRLLLFGFTPRKVEDPCTKKQDLLLPLMKMNAG
jgi:hypothetical protein